MSSRSISLILAAIVTLGGAAVLANPHALSLQPLAQMPVEGGDRGGRGWLKDLDLTPQQTQQIQAIRQQYQAQLTQRRQAMRQAHQELRDLMAGNASADQVRQKFNQVKELRRTLADTQFESMLAIREVLTPTQRQKFADRLQQRGKRGRDRGNVRSELPLPADLAFLAD
jgi:Spy/CpxP family protein refolding chaperone